MTKKINLLIFLLCCVFIQIFLMRNIVWFPDIILLAVVFTGIFFEIGYAVWFGFIAGFLRGCFSVETLPLDVFLFPLCGMSSFVLASKFYKYNPLVQIVITILAMSIVILGHTVYFDVINARPIAFLLPFAVNWKMLSATVLFSPIFFMGAKKFLFLPLHKI